MSISPAGIAKRAAVLTGIGLALGMAGGTAAHADVHAQGKPTAKFDVCAPKAAKCTDRAKARVKGVVLFLPQNVRINASGYEKYRGKTTLTYTIDRKRGADVVRKVSFNGKLKPTSIATNVKVKDLNKITVKLCGGGVCGKPVVLKPRRVAA